MFYGSPDYQERFLKAPANTSSSDLQNLTVMLKSTIDTLIERLYKQRDHSFSELLRITVGAVFYSTYMLIATFSMGYAKKMQMKASIGKEVI